MDGTLLDLFSPPGSLLATGAILVSMSATEDFLQEALRRYTGMSHAQRAAEGDVAAYLFLDAAEDSFSAREIAGLYQFQPSSEAGRRLLHAKVALIGFGPARTGNPSVVRLAVTTANWTQTSARHQLELAWRIDVAIGGSTPSPAKDRSDIACAAGFVDALSRRYDLPTESQPSGTILMRRYRALLRAANRDAPLSAVPRFIHSVEQPLLPQYRKRLVGAGHRGRALVVCGSGSFERHGTKDGPEVFQAISKLPGASDAEKCLVLNPNEAGAVAFWKQKKRQKQGWRLYGARDPSDHTGHRVLHAKFIFVGREHYSKCTGTLYLGSGNLSKRGLLLGPRTTTTRRSEGDGSGTSQRVPGNIEAGVVLKVAKVSREALASSLCWDIGDSLDDEPLKSGAEPVSEEGLKPAKPSSPILVAYASRGRLTLDWVERAVDVVDLSWGDVVLTAVAVGTPYVKLKGKPPATLTVKTGHGKWAIPVIASDGGIARIPRPPSTSFAEGLRRIVMFPPSWEEDDEAEWEDEGGAEGLEKNGSGKPPETRGRRVRKGHTAEADYALHSAAELAEQLSQCLDGLEPEQVPDWIRQLEVEGRDAFPQALVDTWRPIGGDLIGVVGRLAPRWMAKAERERLRAVLARVARGWGFDGA